MRLILRRYSTGVGVGGLLDTAGTKTGAVSGLQAFTSGIVTGIVRPASNSTTAFRVQNAAGSASVIVVDTVSALVGINKTPTAPYVMDIAGPIRFSDGGNNVFFSPSYPGINEVGACVLVNASTDLAILLSDGSAGKKIMAAYWDSSASIMRSAWEFANKAGFADLLLVKSGGKVGIGTSTPNNALDVADTNASASAIQNALTMRSTNAGTPAAGFGMGFRAGLKSSTTADQDAGRLTWQWTDATHATRASKGQLSAYYTSTERPTITWGANSTVSLLSFHVVTTPIARPVLATGAGRTADALITVLQNYGLVKQS